MFMTRPTATVLWRCSYNETCLKRTRSKADTLFGSRPNSIPSTPCTNPHKFLLSLHPFSKIAQNKAYLYYVTLSGILPRYHQFFLGGLSL